MKAEESVITKPRANEEDKARVGVSCQAGQTGKVQPFCFMETAPKQQKDDLGETHRKKLGKKIKANEIEQEHFTS